MHKFHHATNRIRHTRDRIWQSMRIMRRFTVHDLMATAVSNYDNTSKFITALADVGVLRCEIPSGARPGVPCRQPAVWKLARDLGPITPQVRRLPGEPGRVIFDHNKNQILRAC